MSKRGFCRCEIASAIKANSRIVFRLIGFYRDEFTFGIVTLNLLFNLTDNILSDALTSSSFLYCKIGDFNGGEISFRKEFLIFYGHIRFWNEASLHVILVIIVQIKCIMAK